MTNQTILKNMQFQNYIKTLTTIFQNLLISGVALELNSNDINKKTPLIAISILWNINGPQPVGSTLSTLEYKRNRTSAPSFSPHSVVFNLSPFALSKRKHTILTASNHLHLKLLHNQSATFPATVFSPGVRVKTKFFTAAPPFPPFPYLHSHRFSWHFLQAHGKRKQS